MTRGEKLVADALGIKDNSGSRAQNFRWTHRVVSLMNPTRDSVINAIEDYKRECLFLPRASWSKFAKLRRSCARGAAEDIVHILKTDERDVHPLVLIQEYVDLMDQFSCEACDTNHEHARLLFQCAWEGAKEILEIFL